MTDRVFISYSTRDVEVAKVVKTYMEASGFSCWFAPHCIHPSENYHRTLIKALDGSAVVLLLLSSASNASADVLAEIAHADHRGMQVVVSELENENASDSLRPLLVGCERVKIAEGLGKQGLSSLECVVRRAAVRNRIARKSKFLALLTSVIPGGGLIYLGRRWPGLLLLVLSASVVVWAHFLEFGTPLDRFLSCVFHSLIGCSVFVTAQLAFGAVSGTRNRVLRWKPYLVSSFFPGAGIALAGRRRCGWVFCWAGVLLYAAMFCTGDLLKFGTCPVDACLWWIVWLIGLAESGFEDADGRHRNPFLYAVVLLLVVAVAYFNVVR